MSFVLFTHPTIHLDPHTFVLCSPSLEELSIHKNQLSEVPTAISSLARFSLKYSLFAAIVVVVVVVFVVVVVDDVVVDVSNALFCQPAHLLSS